MPHARQIKLFSYSYWAMLLDNKDHVYAPATTSPPPSGPRSLVPASKMIPTPHRWFFLHDTFCKEVRASELSAVLSSEIAARSQANSLTMFRPAYGLWRRVLGSLGLLQQSRPARPARASIFNLPRSGPVRSVPRFGTLAEAKKILFGASTR